MQFEVFNAIGSALLLVCSVPQAIKSVRDGHSNGLSRLMLWLWLLGMSFCLVFFVRAEIWPTVINYAFNLFVASTITWYSYFPRRRQSS
jgi:uncharacterized protein with PQ loop repeat